MTLEEYKEKLENEIDTCSQIAETTEGFHKETAAFYKGQVTAFREALEMLEKVKKMEADT